jgi:hypothetical protein
VPHLLLLLPAHASGHAAAPPSSVMNSRLLNGSNGIRRSGAGTRCSCGSISNWGRTVSGEVL